jgi:hypothetical protein
MKIVGFKEFCALPVGAIFSYYEPDICEGLYRKGETILLKGEPIDYFQAYLVPECWNGEAPTVDEIESRWGLYEEDQQYAVFEPADIQVLLGMLSS